MKKGFCYLLLCFLFPVAFAAGNKKVANRDEVDRAVLKEAFKDKFYIGVALNRAQFTGYNRKAVAEVEKHFNSIVAENCMKSEELQPREGLFYFFDADRFIGFGEKNGMHIVGHTLVWHSQAPYWFFTDENGVEVSREILIGRMKDHIQTVVSRYKGKVKGWDVVNEAIEDDGSWRESKFYRIIGEDFVKLAFQFAHEADPDAELYYNDYSMALPGKREGVVRMVKALQEEGVRIDGIGMQGHVDLSQPALSAFEKSIVAFSDLGIKVMITELDVSALPGPWENVGANISDVVDYQEKMNPYPDGLPAKVERNWENRYLDLFRLFLKYSDKIDRVTLWGLSDGNSWKNNFPIRGRTDYPLLFDRDYRAKPIVEKLIREVTNN